MTTFKELNLSNKLLCAIEKKGFSESTKIQSLAIPHLLENKQDIIAQAQTGTGKTLAFALPLVEKLKKSKKTKAIILSPTRELAIQIAEEFESVNVNNLNLVPIYGGQSIDIQFRLLKKGADVIIGTPGRVIDHINRGTLNIKDVEYFILDEADEMLNMGFIEDIEEIFKNTPKNKRVMLFSATMPKNIKKLAEQYMKDYIHLKTKTNLTTDLTKQVYYEVMPKEKFEVLRRIIDLEKEFYAIIFCNTKLDVDELAVKFQNKNFRAEALHGDMSQAQREKIMNKFKNRNVSILISTDLAARGLDVENLTHVINYSIPQNPEIYVHRIGRTGRAGKEGVAVTLISPRDSRKLSFIKRIAKIEIEKMEVPRVEEILKFKKYNIVKEIKNILENENIEDNEKILNELLENNNAENIIKALIQYSFRNINTQYEKITKLNTKTRERKRTFRDNETRLFIALGKRKGFDKKKLVEMLARKANVSKNKINNADVFDVYSFVTVPNNEAEKIMKAFKNEKAGKRALIERAKK